MKGLVIGGGCDVDIDLLSLELEDSDLIICADRGIEYLIQMGVQPDFLMGDFDSFTGELPSDFEGNTKVLTYPRDKNDTDMQLAVDFALEKGCTELILMGAVGTRMDHTQGNISIVVQNELKGVSTIIKGKQNIIQAVKGPKNIIIETDKPYVSAIPVSIEGINISTEGFKFEVENLFISHGDTRGISNTLLKANGVLKVNSGTALVIFAED
ncbi:MAG: thiamine diphosphokinase [Tissierellia bacterium]|nr:thiamine diphosphokinase [Tissierellia bacterium]